ncbi:MAG: HD-GYP domain-containing protein [Chloroflexota bacterium]
MPDQGKILLVEDNHELRIGLRDILTYEGYDVLTAVNGRDAFGLLQGHSPDLILSDITMPEMNGYEFYDLVRAHPGGAGIPFVFLTARGEQEDIMKARNLGAEDYLVKPISRNELLSAIRAKVNRFRQIEMIQLEQSYEASLTMLANAIEVRDQYTRGHVERVRDYSLLLAETMELPEKRIRLIRFGAILHDIGKILVRETTLTKPTPLSKNEWAELRRHPVIGAEMLNNIPYLQEMIGIVRHHHEHWDGSGYPNGLGGEDIPLEARIVSVADSFDAMTTTRPYHPAWPVERAMQELQKGALTYFDPTIVDAFVKLWQETDRIQFILQQYRNELA